jgi:hypothetical protein
MHSRVSQKRVVLCQYGGVLQALWWRIVTVRPAVEREEKSNVTGAGCWRWKVD